MFVDRVSVTKILNMGCSSGFRYGGLLFSIAESWFVSHV